MTKGAALRAFPMAPSPLAAPLTAGDFATHRAMSCRDARSTGVATSTVTAMAAPPTWVVEPSGPLRGDVVISGSKNAVTKHMVAALLADSPSVIDRAPRIGDVDITASMLEALGAHVDIDGERISIDPQPVGASVIPPAFSRLNRIPILFLGPLLHRHGEAHVPLVGGDRIGRRPVDFHIAALEEMGAEVVIGPEGLEAKATRLHGARIRLPFPSVGATENVLLSAVRAEGRTVIENGAVEPEVPERAQGPQRMGAR